MLNVGKGFFHSLIVQILMVVLLTVTAPGSWAASNNQQYQGSSYDARDPWEPFNRKVFSFNDFLDRWLLKPVARGYRAIMPQFLDDGVTNFFSNLGEPINLLNSIFQLKPDAAMTATGRFLFNTTFGLGGFFDVAGRMGLPAHQEDFGQTLGYWGVGTGPYLVLPFLGPSDVRDASGLAVDYFSPENLWKYIHSPEWYYMRGLNAVDTRADLIPAEDLIQGDRYTFLRNAYLQRRQFLVNDGKVDDPFSSGDDSDVMLKGF